MTLKLCSLCLKAFKPMKGKGLVWVKATNKDINDAKKGKIFATICVECVDKV